MAVASKRTGTVKAVEDYASETRDSVMARAERMREDASDVGSRIAAGAQDVASSVGDRLKSVGVDTDVMTEAAKEHATQLQQLIADELKTRPMRALGVAAAVGLVVGLMTAR